MEQNVIDLGWDLQKWDSQTQEVLKGLISVYEISKKLDSHIITPGAGWTELSNKVKGLESDMKALQDANVRYIQTVTNVNASHAVSVNSLVAVKGGNEKVTKSIQDKDKAEQAALKTKQQSIKVDQEVVKQMTLEEKQRQAEIKTLKEQASYQDTLDKARKRSQSQAEAEAKIAAQLTNEYAILNKSLVDAELKYKNLALTQGFEAEATKQALEQALSIRNVLDKLDGNLKNYQRNVGNYKSAFDGLGVSFTQIARELPSLTISAQQFFLAISNNLPMVFDEIGKARRDIAALKEQGKEAPSLARRILGSVLSFNVFLSAGIALVTAYSKEIIQFGRDLFGMGESADAAAKRLELVTNAVKELNKELEKSDFAFRDINSQNVEELKKELEIMQALGKSNEDMLKMKGRIIQEQLNNNDIIIKGTSAIGGSTGALKEYNRELEESKATYDDLINQYIKFVQAGPSALDKGEYEKGISRLKESISVQKDQYDKLKKTVDDYHKFSNDLAANQLELEKYRAEQKVMLETETAKIIAQARINENERTLSDERNFEDKRDRAIKDRLLQRKKIIQEDLKSALSNPANVNGSALTDSELDYYLKNPEKITGDRFTSEAKIAAKKAIADRVEAEKDADVEIFKNHEEFRKRRLAAELEVYNAQTEFAAAQYKQISESEAHSFAERMEAYGDYYRNEQQLIKADYEYQKATKVMTNAELLALDAEFHKKETELQIKAKKEISDIIVNNSQSQLTEAEAKDKLKLSEEELALFRSIKNKEKFKVEAAKKEIELQKGTLQNAIANDEALLRNNKVTEEEKKKAQLRIYENQARLNQLELSDEEKKEAKKKSIHETYWQLEQIGVDTFFSLWQKLEDARYQKRIANLEAEAKALDENYNREVNNIRNSTLSQQEQAAQIALLTAQHAAQKEEIARKEKEEKIKQAKTDKAITIAKIITETALAVVHQLTTGDPYTATARAVLAGAMGAAELATAIATPLPSYEKGTDNHPGGPARYGEAGPEIVQEPGKRPFIATSETISNLAKGTKVIPINSNMVQEYMYRAAIRETKEQLQLIDYVEKMKNNDRLINKLIDTVENGNIATVQALKKQKQSITNIIIDSSFGNYIQKRVIN